MKKMGIPVAIQLTFACPNIGENFRELVSTEEKIEVFKIFSELDIHVGVKINVFQSILEILEIVKKVQCSWVEIPNTYPIEKANKKFLFRYAGGGTSSRKNFEAALDWHRRVQVQRLKNQTQTICGGVFCKKDVLLVKEAGFDGCAFSRVVPYRPWRVKGIIKQAIKIFQKPKRNRKCLKTQYQHQK